MGHCNIGKFRSQSESQINHEEKDKKKVKLKDTLATKLNQNITKRISAKNCPFQINPIIKWYNQICVNIERKKGWFS